MPPAGRYRPEWKRTEACRVGLLAAAVSVFLLAISRQVDGLGRSRVCISYGHDLSWPWPQPCLYLFMAMIHHGRSLGLISLIGSMGLRMILVRCWVIIGITLVQWLVRAGFLLVFSFCCIIRFVWFCLIILVGVVCWVDIVDCLLIGECSVRLVRVLFNVFDDISLKISGFVKEIPGSPGK